MVHGFLCLSSALAIIASAAFFLTASAANSEKKRGNAAEVDNRFIVGNWRQGSVDEPVNFEDPLSMVGRSQRSKNQVLKDSTSSIAIISEETPTKGQHRQGERDGTSDRVGKENHDKWGNSADEGLDNRFVVGNLEQRNKSPTVKKPPSMFPFRMSKSKAAVNTSCIYCRDGVTCIQDDRYDIIVRSKGVLRINSHCQL